MAQPVENSPFTIYNRREIVFVLEGLIKNHTTLTLEANGSVSLVTAIVSLSADNNYVYIDVSGDEEINDKILLSKRVKFSTQTGVRVRWQTQTLRYVELSDGNAFEIPMPESIERIQRREYFRLHTPQGNNGLVCKIAMGEEGEEFYSATVADMSVGGLGISIRGEKPPFIFHGAILSNCSVVFPSVGKVPFALKVCGIFDRGTAKSGETLYHVGTEFKDLSRGASNVVQRYMVQLESERISLS